MNEDTDTTQFGGDDAEDSQLNENPVVTGDDTSDVVQLNDVQEAPTLAEAINEVQAGDGEGDAEADQELAEELASDDAPEVNDTASPAADEAEALANAGDDEGDNEPEAELSDEEQVEETYRSCMSAPEAAVNEKVVELRADGVRHKRLSKTKVLHD